MGGEEGRRTGVEREKGEGVREVRSLFEDEDSKLMWM